MSVMKLCEGTLKVDISSEGNYIPSGSPVVIEEVVDNFKNIFILVTGMFAKVRLPYYDTDVKWLVGK